MCTQAKFKLRDGIEFPHAQTSWYRVPVCLSHTNRWRVLGFVNACMCIRKPLAGICPQTYPSLKRISGDTAACVFLITTSKCVRRTIEEIPMRGNSAPLRFRVNWNLSVHTLRSKQETDRNCEELREVFHRHRCEYDSITHCWENSGREGDGVSSQVRTRILELSCSARVYLTIITHTCARAHLITRSMGTFLSGRARWNVA